MTKIIPVFTFVLAAYYETCESNVRSRRNRRTPSVVTLASQVGFNSVILDDKPEFADELADAIVSAMRFYRRKPIEDSEKRISVVAKRLVEHLDRRGFVVLQKPPVDAALVREHERSD